MKNDEIRKAVRERYGQRAKQTSSCCGEPAPAQTTSCCDEPSCCGGSATVNTGTYAEMLYSPDELSNLPRSVTDVAAGCGNPTALAELKPGEVVLDLGSGGGIDCFLAARKVGSSGKVIGVDMTPEMIQLARGNAGKMRANNVEFRLGELEHLPVETGTMDVVISNCVICLSPTKEQVFREAFRVLKPGGRLHVSDMVRKDGTPTPDKIDIEQWTCCIAGAIEKSAYLDKIAEAGFTEIIAVREDDVPLSIAGDSNVISMKVRALKP